MQLLDTITSFLITSAHADTNTAAQVPQQGNFSFFIMVAVLLVFMYFAIWRPQSKRAREQRDLLTSLAKGDEVITTGGLVGTINKINENYIGLMLAENVEITLQKAAIVSVLPKGTLKSLQ